MINIQDIIPFMKDDKRFKLKAGDIKTATYRALKRYLDEEFKEVLDA